MNRPGRHHAPVLGGFAVVLAAALAIAVIAVADAGGGDDVDDTITVTTPVQLLPLAKRTGDVVQRSPGVSVRVRTPGGDASLTALCAGQVDVALGERRLTADERETCIRNGLRPTTWRIGHQAVAVYASGRLDIGCLTLRRDARAVRDIADFEHILPDAPAALGVYGIGLLGRDGLRIDTVAIDAGDGCVRPRPAAVRAGRYPLAEPLFAYTTRSALEREPVARFFDTLIERAPEFADYAGVLPPAGDDAR